MNFSTAQKSSVHFEVSSHFVNIFFSCHPGSVMGELRQEITKSPGFEFHIIRETKAMVVPPPNSNNVEVARIIASWLILVGFSSVSGSEALPHKSQNITF
jgi:hypothetical protein